MKNIKKNKNKIISVVLVVALLVTGAFAFLTAKDVRSNKFTVGNMDIELLENFDTNVDGELTDNENNIKASENTDVFTDKTVTPNKEVLKQPWIENTGESPAYVYMEIGVPKASTDDITIVDADGNVVEPIDEQGNPLDAVEIFTLLNKDTENWGLLGATRADDDYNYYLYYYKQELDPGAETTQLFEAVRVVNYANSVRVDSSTVNSFDDFMDVVTEDNIIPGENEEDPIFFNITDAYGLTGSDITGIRYNGTTYPMDELIKEIDQEGTIYYKTEDGDMIAIEAHVEGMDGLYIMMFIDGETGEISPAGVSAVENSSSYVKTTMTAPINTKLPINAYGIQVNNNSNSPAEAWQNIVTEYEKDNSNVLSRATNGNGVKMGPYEDSDYDVVEVNFYTKDGDVSPASVDASGYNNCVMTITLPAGSTIGSFSNASIYTRPDVVAMWELIDGTQLTGSEIFEEDTDVYLVYESYSNINYIPGNWLTYTMRFDANGYPVLIPDIGNMFQSHTLTQPTELTGVDTYDIPYYEVADVTSILDGTYQLPAYATITLTNVTQTSHYKETGSCNEGDGCNLTYVYTLSECPNIAPYKVNNLTKVEIKDNKKITTKWNNVSLTTSEVMTTLDGSHIDRSEYALGDYGQVFKAAGFIKGIQTWGADGYATDAFYVPNNAKLSSATALGICGVTGKTITANIPVIYLNASNDVCTAVATVKAGRITNVTYTPVETVTETPIA